jgi:hypothetical protein
MYRIVKQATDVGQGRFARTADVPAPGTVRRRAAEASRARWAASTAESAASFDALAACIEAKAEISSAYWDAAVAAAAARMVWSAAISPAAAAFFADAAQPAAADAARLTASAELVVSACSDASCSWIDAISSVMELARGRW